MSATTGIVNMDAHTVVQIGMGRIIDMARRGELNNRWTWAAVRGGWKYVVAMVTKRAVSDPVAAARCGWCVRCEALDVVDTAKAGLQAGYCGNGSTGKGGPTCGCLVTITVDGAAPQPAGKLWVRSELCPRGHWAEVTH
jgi:hypothetical protein